MPQVHTNKLLDLMAATLAPYGGAPPFQTAQDMHSTIDATLEGDAPWTAFEVQYNGPIPSDNAPSWMSAKYTVWQRDALTVVKGILSNPDFASDFDATPYREDVNGKRRWTNFMSGDWAWEMGDMIAVDGNTHGSMLIPIILGSDKTTVSVATGQNEYWPVYLSIGNVHNNVRRAHRNAVVLIAFLNIPKSKLPMTHSSSL